MFSVDKLFKPCELCHICSHHSWSRNAIPKYDVCDQRSTAQPQEWSRYSEEVQERIWGISVLGSGGTCIVRARCMLHDTAIWELAPQRAKYTKRHRRHRPDLQKSHYGRPQTLQIFIVRIPVMVLNFTIALQDKQEQKDKTEQPWT